MAKAEARTAFQYGLAIFTLTALLGLANATQLFGALDRNTLLTHLHSGTLGWITMGVIGLTIWLFGAQGKTMAVRVSAVSFNIILPVLLGALLWGGLWLRDRRLQQLLPLTSKC